MFLDCREGDLSQIPPKTAANLVSRSFKRIKHFYIITRTLHDTSKLKYYGACYLNIAILFMVYYTGCAARVRSRDRRIICIFSFFFRISLLLFSLDDFLLLPVIQDLYHIMLFILCISYYNDYNNNNFTAKYGGQSDLIRLPEIRSRISRVSAAHYTDRRVVFFSSSLIPIILILSVHLSCRWRRLPRGRLRRSTLRGGGEERVTAARILHVACT